MALGFVLALKLVLPAWAAETLPPVDDSASPLRQGVAQLTVAGNLFRAGDLAGAKKEYAKVLNMSGAPQHQLGEARQRLTEIERRQAGLPARDPAASHVQLPPPRQPGTILHVSAQGDDKNPGTADKPFATLEKARDTIRAMKQRGPLPAGGVVVEVHGGEYAVKETFKLTAEDSGTEASPIVYRAAAGEMPRFRGGIRLTGFKPVQDAAILDRLPQESRGKVVQVDLKSCGVTNLLPLKLGGFASGNGFKTHPAHEIFFNGRALAMARGPNERFLHITDVVVKDGTKGYDRQGSKTGKFVYTGERPQTWVNEPDLLLYGYWFWDWADSYERVANIDPEQRVITLAQPWHNYGFSIGAPFYAVNALCELDLPGEWYLERHSGRFFVYPPSDIGSAQVEMSLFAKTMLQLDNVSNVRFEGLGWELGSADAIHVKGGSNCLFAGCTVRHFAGNGVTIDGGEKHGLLSCDIYSMGRGGTTISGGDRKTLTPGGHFVENCHIHHLSRIDHTYTPAVILSGVGNRIAHNSFHDVLSSGMRVGGNDQVVEFNEIYNVVLESDDQGGADMFGNPTYRGNVYRYNYWHHIGNWRGTGEHPKCGQAGIRLDDAISGTVIYGNIFERCSFGKVGFGGVQIHGGKDNIVDNNLFVDCAAVVSFSPWSDKRWQEFALPKLEDREIDKALYRQRYPELAHLGESANTNHIYRNLALRCGELFRRPHKRVNAFENTMLTEGEFSKKAAHAILNRPGFAPIPVDEIGLYTDPHRKTLPEPEL